ncbi:hypothetical protein HMI56_004942 [Coelomomyces lativittatus]|nr:hypothetical protein HMI56_004942 [Coelomomyces lativittatus]
MAQTPSGFSFHLTPFLTYALKTLRFRKHVSSLILTGQLQTAQHVCQQVFPPHFFPSPPHVAMSLDDLRFQFDTHQFLEWVRAHQPTQALQFSHTVMLAAHLTSTHPDVVSTLSDMFALIAYPIPAQSPLASYVDLDRRKAFAQWINRFILKLHRPDPENLLTPSTSSSSHSTTGGESTLQKVIQQWCVVHELLE